MERFWRYRLTWKVIKPTRLLLGRGEERGNSLQTHWGRIGGPRHLSALDAVHEPLPPTWRRLARPKVTGIGQGIVADPTYLCTIDAFCHPERTHTYLLLTYLCTWASYIHVHM